MSDKLLEVTNLSKLYKIGGLVIGSLLAAVDAVDISMPGDRATILSVVGESGSGKTTLARMMLRLVDPTSGTIQLEGRDIYKGGFRDRDFKAAVQPIFQNPFESFSIHRHVDAYLYDTARNFGIAKNRKEAQTVVAEVLESVGLDMNRVAGKYNSQFSGGELQRIAVARALITRPKLIVADEPVAMIDASLRMNVINLFKRLQDEFNVNLIYITHDLSTAYYVSDHIAVMYRGSIVEYGPSNEILTEPAHPYTELLLDSVSKIGEKWRDDVPLPDVEIKEYGAKACKFAERCRYVKDICRRLKPPMVSIDEERRSLCFRPVDYQEQQVS